MISIGIYTTMLLLMFYVLVGSSIRLRSKQRETIEEQRDSISRFLNQRILKFDERFDAYTDKTRQWQEEFNDKIIDLKSHFDKCSKKRITFSNYDQLAKELKEILFEVQTLMQSEKKLQTYKVEARKYISNLQILLLENENDAALKLTIKRLTDMLQTDPIGAYEAIRSIAIKKNENRIKMGKSFFLNKRISKLEETYRKKDNEEKIIRDLQNKIMSMLDEGMHRPS